MGSFSSTPRVVEKRWTLKLQSGSNGGITSLVPLDHDCMLTGYSHGTVAVWSVEKGEALIVFKHGRSCTAVAALPRDPSSNMESGSTERVLAGASDGTIAVFELPEGRRVGNFSGGCGSVQFLYAIDSDTFVSGHETGWLQVWNIRSGARTHQMRHGTSALAALTVRGSDAIISARDSTTTHDGEQRLATELVIWSITEDHAGEPRGLTGARVSTVNLDFLVSSALDLDQYGVALGSSTGAVELWQLWSGEARRSDSLQHGPQCPVQSMARKDADTLLAAFLDGTVLIWRLLSSPVQAPYLTERFSGASTISLMSDRMFLLVGHPEPRGRYHCGGKLEVWSVTASSGQTEEAAPDCSVTV